MRIKDVNFYLLLMFIVFFAIDYRISFFFIFLICLFVIINSSFKYQIKFTSSDLFILIYIGISFVFYNRGDDNLLIYSRTAIYPWLIFLTFKYSDLDTKKIQILFMFLSITTFVITSILMLTDLNGNLNINLNFLLNRTRRDFMYWETSQIIGPTNLSALAGINIILCLYFLKSRKKILSLFFYFILLFSVIYILILSSRTTWIALALISFIYFGYKNNNFYVSKIILRSFISFFIISIFIFLVPSFDFIGFQDLESRFNFFLTLQDDNLDARFIRWIIASDLIAKNLFGYGFSYYGYYTNLQTPHNEILGQMVSVGILGTLSYLLIYLSIFRSIWKIKKDKAKEFLLYFMVFCFVLITSITEYYSFAMYNLLHPLILILFGLSQNRFIDYKKVIND